MIDHLGIAVSDFERAKKFYQQALAPLGYAVVMEWARSTVTHRPEENPQR